jgi:large subunit ribosomal protein L17
MKHSIKQKKLNRKPSHRKALLRNLSISLAEHGRIKTTLPKAKALRPYFEKIITAGKDGTLHARRKIISKLGNIDAAAKIITDLSPKYAERKGGYTRILKIGHRAGDAAPMAIIELV